MALRCCIRLDCHQVLAVNTQDLTMMMAAMKAKQGILNTGNILDIVCEGAEVGASLPGDAGFPENVEFSVG